MNKAPENQESIQIDTYLQNLHIPLKPLLLQLRHMFVQRHLALQIKWNAICVYDNAIDVHYKAKSYLKDLLVVNVNKPAYLLLVFPNGALLQHSCSMMEGTYSDGRRMIYIRTPEDLRRLEQGLEGLIRAWQHVLTDELGR